MSAPQEDRALALQVELTEIIQEETGLHEPIATQIAERVLRGLRRRRGGDELYVPKGSAGRARDEKVRSAYKGNNRDEVCRDFGISRSTFYSILARRK